jgi:hypothetical protein
MAPVQQSAEQAEFLAVICADPDLLRAEFEAIIDACWEQPPPPRWTRLLWKSDRSASRTDRRSAMPPWPCHPRGTGRPRQRSPPRERIVATNTVLVPSQYLAGGDDQPTQKASGEHLPGRRPLLLTPRLRTVPAARATMAHQEQHAAPGSSPGGGPAGNHPGTTTQRSPADYLCCMGLLLVGRVWPATIAAPSST